MGGGGLGVDDIIIGPQFHGKHTKNCRDYFTVVLLLTCTVYHTLKAKITGISHNLIKPIYYYYIVVIYDLLCLKLHANLGRNLKKLANHIYENFSTTCLIFNSVFSDAQPVLVLHYNAL